MNKISCFLWILIGTFLYADGIPVRDGKITVPYEIITLDSSQVEELVLLGTVTLTREQYAYCRKISKFCPKRIEKIIPIDREFKDCVCGTVFYVIQLAVNEIALLKDEVWDFNDLPSFFESIYEQNIGFRFNVDYRGQFYYGGMLIPFPMLIKIIQGPYTYYTSEEINSVRIVLPFGMTKRSNIISARLDEIENIVKKLNIELVII